MILFVTFRRALINHPACFTVLTVVIIKQNRSLRMFATLDMPYTSRGYYSSIEVGP